MDVNDVIADAYKTNEGIASALFALIDQDEDEWRTHPDITVNLDGDDIVSVEYDSSGTIDHYRQNVGENGQRLLHEYPAEVVVGWGRPLEITLSGGGPTVWVEAVLDSDGDVMRAVLRASHNDAERTWHLARHTSLFRLAEYYADLNRAPESE